MSESHHSSTDAQLALLVHKMDELAKSNARMEERLASFDESIRGDGASRLGLMSRMDAAEREIDVARETAAELKRGFIRLFYSLVASLIIGAAAVAWKYLASGAKVPPTP